MRRVPQVRIGEWRFGPWMDQFALVKCRGCGLEYLNPRPSPGLLQRFYDAPGYDPHTLDGAGVDTSRVFEQRLKVLLNLHLGEDLTLVACWQPT